MNSKQYRELLESYDKVYEQSVELKTIGIKTKNPEESLQKMIDRQGLGGKVVKNNLQKSHYEFEGDEIVEDNVADEELESVEEEKDGGVNKKTEVKFHKNLDTMVHKTFGKRPEEKQMKEEIDIFDIILEHLVAEGYADTDEAALAIMANMSEEWKQSICENIEIS